MKRRRTGLAAGCGLLFVLLTLVAGCGRKTPAELLVAYSGDCQGYLEPCG